MIRHLVCESDDCGDVTHFQSKYWWSQLNCMRRPWIWCIGDQHPREIAHKTVFVWKFWKKVQLVRFLSYFVAQMLIATLKLFISVLCSGFCVKSFPKVCHVPGVCNSLRTNKVYTSINGLKWSVRGLKWSASGHARTQVVRGCRRLLKCCCHGHRINTAGYRFTCCDHTGFVLLLEVNTFVGTSQAKVSLTLSSWFRFRMH